MGDHSKYHVAGVLSPDAPCMEYLNTFGPFLGKLYVNIPYMEHLGSGAMPAMPPKCGFSPSVHSRHAVFDQAVEWDEKWSNSLENRYCRYSIGGILKLGYPLKWFTGESPTKQWMSWGSPYF